MLSSNDDSEAEVDLQFKEPQLHEPAYFTFCVVKVSLIMPNQSFIGFYRRFLNKNFI